MRALVNALFDGPLSIFGLLTAIGFSFSGFGWYVLNQSTHISAGLSAALLAVGIIGQILHRRKRRHGRRSAS